ncbi:MAG TPA: hypothetical protein VME42_03965 [Steroidobacteraceae bacterium]|nr:hypothetical protein [Steroidobacteraceae bacterium]
MNEPPQPQEPPECKRRGTVWPNVVWSVPLAALLVVIYLAVQALAHRGEIVTVTFRRAAGAQAGETKVYYQGAVAGRLIKIVPNKDGQRIDFRLRLVPEAKSGLNTNARFWLIGASPNFADLSSLKAVLSGVEIGYAPGRGGTPTTHFEGLDHAPIILPGDKGTPYVLAASDVGSVRDGSVLLFHGKAIGRVTGIQFEGEQGFRLGIFVFRPYDSLVKTGARFWKASPLRLSFAAGGIHAQLAPLGTILSGGIELGDEEEIADAPQSKPATEFILYDSRSAARAALSGPTVPYQIAFHQAAGGLEEDAPVTLLGFQIGAVTSTRLAYDPLSGEPYTLVTVLLYPRRMDLTAAPAAAEDWRSRTDAALERLLRLGFRAELRTTPAIFGAPSVALVRVRGGRRAVLARDDVQGPRIPAVSGAGGLDELTAQAGRFFDTLNELPLQAIAANVRRVTARLDRLTASPQMGASVTHLSSVLANLDKILGTTQPKVGPLLDQLHEAAAQLTATVADAHRLLRGGGGEGSLADGLQEMTQAAVSIRTLADYLSRHPEALLRGKRADR